MSLPDLLAKMRNRFEAEAPRVFAITGEEVAGRVLHSPGFAETTLTLSENRRGFVHFGPRENWWFLTEERRLPDPAVGMIYALCAEDTPTLMTLLQTAETQLLAAGAREIYLYPTWAQGAIPFYNGLTASNEVSGLWAHHRLVAVAQEAGYTIHARYELGLLPRPADLPQRETPDEARFAITPFPTPLIPGAMRLTMTIGEVEAGHVVMAPGAERRRATGVNEWAAFDVAVRESFRGKGWGKHLMHSAVQWAFADAGADAVQLHVVLDNLPATNLYFRSLGFQRNERERFVTLKK